MPVASFRISIAASVMTLPEGSTTTPLRVASVDWARTNVVAQRINNSRRRAQRYFKRRLLKQTGKMVCHPVYGNALFICVCDFGALFGNLSSTAGFYGWLGSRRRYVKSNGLPLGFLLPHLGSTLTKP